MKRRESARDRVREKERVREERAERRVCGGGQGRSMEGDEDGKVRLTRPPERDRIEPRADSAVGVVTCRGSYTLRLPCSLARLPVCLSALPDSLSV